MEKKTQLPEEFCLQTRQLMGEERFQRYLESFQQQVPVSIRLNPRKVGDGRWKVEGGEPVPWCDEGYYLPCRPNFTMDPLLHAGCYYVQEAASMFLDEVLRQTLGDCPPECTAELTQCTAEPTQCTAEPTLLCTSECHSALDLCAAPGGKSTLLRTALPEDCVLYSNEPIRNRASILLENVTKWGYRNHFVTNCYPKDYRASKLTFDVILCDVPCSGEGMFRKDEATIREWSPQNVEKCWRLQREIVSDAWACLNPGGLLIYSTCTFNTKENEENIRWILQEFDAEVLPIDVKPEWHITGSLLPGFTEPVYRFIPGISRGEGLFMCALRKGGTASPYPPPAWPPAACHPLELVRLPEQERDVRSRGWTSVRTHLPSLLGEGSGVRLDLSYPQAIAYLRGEALILPADTPRGIVTVAFMGHPLGQVKNIGTRANNLYPKEWRIKTTHIPSEPPQILEQIVK